jgi:hypothetical protein|tara:strand:- start:4142 stop:4441 length:300 start_codon:yes stop_codon:yes gene_type:complete
MKYRYQDFLYDYDYGTGKLYKGDNLIFKGNGWSGILFFLSATKNAPEVRAMFQQQLDTREEYKHKAEAKKPREPVIEDPEPEQKKVIRRPGRNDKRLVR